MAAEEQRPRKKAKLDNLDESQNLRLDHLLETLEKQLIADWQEYHTINDDSQKLLLFGTFVKEVLVSDDERSKIWRDLYNLMRFTFPQVPKPILEHLKNQDSRPFGREWAYRKVKDFRIALVDWGAPFPVPLSHEAVEQQSRDGLVYWHNPMSTHGSLIAYMRLQAAREILELFSGPSIRLVIAADSPKLRTDQKKPTPPHSDEPRKGALKRTQMVFVDKSRGSGGKSRELRVLVAGRKSMEIIHAIENIRPGFSTVKSEPLFKLIQEYSIGIKGPSGFVAFNAGVIHYETEGKGGEQYRIYCGIQVIEEAAATPEIIQELIVLAYFREHGIDLASFNRGANKKSLFFVNGKNTQSYKTTQGVDKRVVDELPTQLPAMKEYLRDLTDFRLRLYGLKPTDLY